MECWSGLECRIHVQLDPNDEWILLVSGVGEERRIGDTVGRRSGLRTDRTVIIRRYHQRFHACFIEMKIPARRNDGVPSGWKAATTCRDERKHLNRSAAKRRRDPAIFLREV